MRIRPVARALAVAGALASATACAPATREVLRANERLFHAIATRDTATLAALATPEFRYRDADGKTVDRATWLAGLAAIPGTIESVTNDDLHVTQPSPTVAILRGHQRAILVVDGKRVVDDARFCDRWERRDGGWHVVFAGPP